jgi:hypothetical protein
MQSESSSPPKHPAPVQTTTTVQSTSNTSKWIVASFLLAGCWFVVCDLLQSSHLSSTQRPPSTSPILPSSPILAQSESSSSPILAHSQLPLSLNTSTAFNSSSLHKRGLFERLGINHYQPLDLFRRLYTRPNAHFIDYWPNRNKEDRQMRPCEFQAHIGQTVMDELLSLDMIHMITEKLTGYQLPIEQIRVPLEVPASTLNVFVFPIFFKSIICDLFVLWTWLCYACKSLPKHSCL